MPTLDEELEQSKETFKANNEIHKANVEIHRQIIRGDENTVVDIDGESVPSLRKRVKDVETEWSKTADPLADELADVLNQAKSHKTQAGQSETTATEKAQVCTEKTKEAIAARDEVIEDTGSTTRAMFTMAQAMAKTTTVFLSQLNKDPS